MKKECRRRGQGKRKSKKESQRSPFSIMPVLLIEQGNSEQKSPFSAPKAYRTYVEWAETVKQKRATLVALFAVYARIYCSRASSTPSTAAIIRSEAYFSRVAK